MENSLEKEINNDSTEQTKLSCEYCKKTFANISSLNLHKKTAKYCIKIQEELIIEKEKNIFSCEYCNKVLSTKTNLNVHLKTCKEKEYKQHTEELLKTIKQDHERELLKIINQLTEKDNKHLKEISQLSEKSRLEMQQIKEELNSKHLKEISQISEKSRLELESLKKMYEEKLTALGSEMGAKEIMLKEEIMDLNRYNDITRNELKIRKEEIKELKSTINKYMDNESKRVDKKCDVTPVINKYQTINNIHTHVKPLDTSQERFDNLVTQFYDYPMYKKGVRGMVELLTTFFTYNGTEEENMGKLQAYCSDINRGYIKTLDTNLSEKLHTLSSLFEMCKNSHPLKNKKVDYYNQMLDDLKAELKDDILAYEQSLIHSTDSFSEEKFKECFNKIKEKLYNFYKTITSHNLNQEN